MLTLLGIHCVLHSEARLASGAHGQKEDASTPFVSAVLIQLSLGWSELALRSVFESRKGLWDAMFIGKETAASSAETSSSGTNSI